QHELVALSGAAWVATDLGRVAHLLERLLDAAQVGHAVIDDQDRLHRCRLGWRPSIRAAILRDRRQNDIIQSYVKRRHTNPEPQRRVGVPTFDAWLLERADCKRRWPPRPHSPGVRSRRPSWARTTAISWRLCH